MRRALLAAAFAAFLVPLTASADVGIDRVSHRAARPGDVVRVTASGFLGEPPWPGMPVVMVSAAEAPRSSRLGVTPRMRPERLWALPYRLLGSVRQWRRLPNGHGVGHLTFRVPRVAPDRYLIGLFCDLCVNGPKGSLIIDYELVLRVRRVN